VAPPPPAVEFHLKSEGSYQGPTSVGPSRLAQIKFLSAEGLRAAERSANRRTHPFAEAEETKASFCERWGTHFLGGGREKREAWVTRHPLFVEGRENPV
jgi:hypothetical protein